MRIASAWRENIPHHAHNRSENQLREEISRLMDLQVIDRQLQELELSLTSIAGRVDQIRDETRRASPSWIASPNKTRKFPPPVKKRSGSWPRAKSESATSGCG